MTHGHAPLGERVIGIEIEQIRMIFRLCYINSREKSNGQTAFRHGDICFAVLNRNQRKVVKPVFRNDLADILTYFLTGNTGDQGLVFQMMKRKFLGIFDGVFFWTRNKAGQGMGPGNYEQSWGTGKDFDKAVGKCICSGSDQHGQIQLALFHSGQKMDMDILGQGQLHIGVFPVKYGKNLLRQKGTGDGACSDPQSLFLGEQKRGKII